MSYNPVREEIWYSIWLLGFGMRQFQLLDHTGDLGLVVRGRTLPELFENAGKALFHVITDRRRVRGRLVHGFRLEASDLEGLLVTWMGELLFLFDARGILFRSFQVQAVGGNSMSAQAWGEPYEDGRHTIKTGVKAVTYHQVRISKVQEGLWRAVVVLDI